MKLLLRNSISQLLLLMIVFFQAETALAQAPDLNQPVPRDQNIRHGVLPNGMTYYIRHNEEPKDRASFYIIQNVGALLENDSQNGLAHFLEHMAFNGTEHFPGKGVINGLEKYGVKFGENINAYTYFNETVYNISDVPTENKDAMDMGLMVLNDWSNYLTLDKDEIDSERGVISEEWRTRRNSSFRMRSRYFPVIVKGSKWAERDVIGDLDIINSFKPKTIRDFYHDWYRTDLQAIAIVGDFDAVEMEKKVIALMSKIPAVENAKPRPTFTIPSHDDMRFVVATDKEATSSVVNMMIVKKKAEKQTLATEKQSLIDAIYGTMLNNRIRELLRKSDADCTYGSSSILSEMVKGYGAYSLAASAKPNKEKEAFEIIYTETVRAKQHGFLQSELDRAKLDFDAYFERKFNSRDKITNDDYASKIKTEYLKGEIATAPEFDYQFAKYSLQTISLDDVNKVSSEWFVKKNRTVYITGPSEGVKHMTKLDVEKVIADVDAKELAHYVDETAGLKLIDADKIMGGKVVSTKKLDKFGATEWTLSNGAKVIFRHADYDKDAVSINAWSKGGTSIYGDDKIVSANNLTNAMSKFGVADYDETTLNKLLAGKSVGVDVYLGKLEEGVTGASSVKDFESMMQLVYLKFEKPRFDEGTFKIQKSKLMSSIESMATNPQKIMGDSIQAIVYNHNPRVRFMNEEYLNDLKFDEIKSIYNDRFVDASDFTFLIVGNVSEDVVKPLVEKYIGAIKDIDREENWVDRKVRGPKGVTERKLYFPLETPKGTSIAKYSKEMKYTPYNRLALEVIKEVLDFRFTTEIREKEGGTYGVGLYTSFAKYPVNNMALIFQFDSKPEKAEYLKNRCFEVIDDFVANGPTQEELDKVKQNMLKNREQSKEHNSYWSGVIKNYFVLGEDRNDSKNYEDIVKAFSTKDIKKTASKIFKKIDKVDILILPTEMEKK
ncbi:MAG: insulinase family protein [Flavobacteriales bacterium]|nr:insulinase family protein [Flavobacteriales bacterium]